MGHVVVMALTAQFKAGDQRAYIERTVLTDEHGDYRIYWLGPGRYYVAAVYEDPRRRTINMSPTAPGTNAGAVSSDLSSRYTSGSAGWESHRRSLWGGLLRHHGPTRCSWWRFGRRNISCSRHFDGCREESHAPYSRNRCPGDGRSCERSAGTCRSAAVWTQRVSAHRTNER